MTKGKRLSDDAFNGWAKCQELIGLIEFDGEKDDIKGAYEWAEKLVTEAQFLRDTLKNLQEA